MKLMRIKLADAVLFDQFEPVRTGSCKPVAKFTESVVKNCLYSYPVLLARTNHLLYLENLLQIVFLRNLTLFHIGYLTNAFYTGVDKNAPLSNSYTKP